MNESIRRNPARTGRLAAAVALLLAASAQAADFSFDIPSGDLKAALDAYVKQTGQQIVYKSDDVKGKTTPGVHGSLSEQQALDALLKGTGLQLRRDDSGAVVVFPAEAVAGGASTKTAGGEDQKLEEIIVTGTAISQIYTTSRTVTRIDADPMLLPMSVSSVQGDLLRYQQASSVTDALANVSGMTTSPGGLATSRGFLATGAQNGVAFGGNLGGYVSTLPVVATDRIEVVKGPEQIIQGSAAGIGGTVNIVTKVPTPDSYAFFGTAAGSNGYYRLDSDVNGTLLSGKYGRLMGEVIGSISDQGDGPKGTVGPSNDYVSAGLRWTSDEFGSDLSVVYQHNHVVFGRPPMAIGGEHLHNGDRLYVLGDVDSKVDQTSDLVDVHFQQRIVGTWTLDLNYLSRDDSTSNFGYNEFGDPSTPQVLYAFQSRSRGDSDMTEVYRAGIHGQLDVGPVTNRLLLAYDYQTTDGKYAPVTFLGIYETDLAAGTKNFVQFDPPMTGSPSWSSQEQTGVMLTDQVSWQQWHALLGVRWLTAHREYKEGKPVYYLFKQDDDATLPQYGLVYAVNPRISLYASSTEGFRAVGDLRNARGELLPNTTYTQYEGGAKLLLLDNRVALTTALYQLKQTNVPQYVGEGIDQRPIYTTVSGITSKGVEIELAGQPIRGLEVRTTFAYQDSVNDDTGDPPPTGYTPANFTLWSQYWFGRTPGDGWWLGGGVTAFDAPERAPGEGTWPGNTQLDLSAGYQGEHWQATAGIKNVGDVEGYYPIVGGPIWGSAYYSADRVPGRDYRFDLSYRF